MLQFLFAMIPGAGKYFNLKTGKRFFFFILILLCIVAFCTSVFLLQKERSANASLKLKYEKQEQKIKEKDQEISSLNDRINSLLIVQKVLQDTVEETNKKLDLSRMEHMQIHDNLSQEEDAILKDPANYEALRPDSSPVGNVFIFRDPTSDQSNQKVLTNEGSAKVSEARAKAMWNSYCKGGKCK